jgi:hypothetical protein
MYWTCNKQNQSECAFENQQYTFEWKMLIMIGKYVWNVLGEKSNSNIILLFLPVAQQLLVGQGLLIIEALRLYSGTTHSAGLLWTSDQPDAETSTWLHTTITRDTPMPPAEFKHTSRASDQQTYALHRGTIAIGYYFNALNLHSVALYFADEFFKSEYQNKRT